MITWGKVKTYWCVLYLYTILPQIGQPSAFPGYVVVVKLIEVKTFYDEVCSNGLLQFCTFVISSAVRVHFWLFCCNSITCLGKLETKEQEQETGTEFAQKAARAEMTQNSRLSSSWNRGLGLGTLFMSRNMQKEMGDRTTMSEWKTCF